MPPPCAARPRRIVAGDGVKVGAAVVSAFDVDADMDGTHVVDAAIAPG